ncbi:MAG TPA: TetR/AcrR family transcriptional regulator [Acidimicrobiales bacterium]|nr:TetR/AcrR family transcriptional regulator [Acidimicrobiales bacterium]
MATSDTAEVAPSDAPHRRGRRLSADRSDVILETVLDLLKEVGYDQIRMQDVADRAAVGLSTIYRRWPTKQDVVRAALECDKATAKFATTGDARADLKSFLIEMAAGLSGEGAQNLLGFLAVLRSDPGVCDVFRETMVARMHDHLRGLLASELGDDFPDLDLRARVAPAVLIYQAAICGERLGTDALIERLTELLFAPLPDALCAHPDGVEGGIGRIG